MKGVTTLMPITSIEDKAQRRLEIKARSTLMVGIPNEHQLKFNSIKDAKQLMEAIEKRFEMLDQKFNRLQKLVSQLELLGVKLSHEDVKQNLLRSLSPEWTTHAEVWRNKTNLDTMSIDDLYNNIKMAMLTMRARRFLKKTGRKLTINGNETIRFDKTNVECYNCHKRGHFAREYKAPRSQDTKKKESTRRTVPMEIPASTALVSCDILCDYDWSDQAEEVENNSSKEETKAVRKNLDASIVEKPKAVVNVVQGNVVNAIKASACWVLKPKTKVTNYVSKHNSASITQKNFDYVDAQDYEEIDGGYVAFGGNPKGGKITSKVVTDDYSRFTWIFFLSTKDEISGILKSFITRIENLVEHKVKVTRCDNGTEFKNREIHQFYKINGILRQYSIARTLQQNRIAERTNKTLIKAARTMLADSKLPTTFWVEVVNIACYVQNIVLVVKPHNKTTYELFHGRTPTLCFTKLFGCLVTILNTLDHVDKFDGKADERFVVEYSLSSKAFRVFNSRKMIVEENLHIRFSENTPNVVGTQSNGFAGTKACDNACQAKKEKESVKDYILLPLWTVDPLFSQNPKSSQDDGFQPLSDSEKNFNEDPSKGSECRDQEQEDNVNNTNNVNTASINGVNIMDVKSAFLYGKIEEKVYVCQPPGFKDPDFPNKMYKVEKALFGLHQAPRAWYETLSTYLLDNGFHRGKRDKTLFIRRHKGDILLVQVYVDDIIFGSTKKELCIAFENMMHAKFQISSKSGYTSTLMETQKPLLKDEDGEEVDVYMYRSMIGSLMYLTSLRPDIMFALCACARYQVNPNVSHHLAVKMIFRYLKGQPKFGLWHLKDSLFDLVAYTDSDYAGASLDRKSTIEGMTYYCELKVNATRNNLQLLESVIDEAVYKEMDDSLVRAATTASSLEAKQDSGNINQTQSKATPNESISQGTNSGGGPKFQEAIGDTIALTRVLDLEKTKTTQALKIDSLKRRVKRLEKKQRSRTHKLKRLYKVGLTARVEFSEDEQCLEKATLFMQHLEKRRKLFAAKRAEEKRNKLPTRAQQRSIMCTYLKTMEGWKLNSLKNKSFANIQELFDKAMKKVNTFVEYNSDLVAESSKKAEAKVMEGSSKRACTEMEQESSVEIS
uniref:Integrase catalytic domain-containing protein n=1 Tax=Tanacetum cinerariifolium TaxID=118510 RepID=A0A6L2JA64_TANCI|nr:hypothetical protein [Tanacetum cinerariifolium]